MSFELSDSSADLAAIESAALGVTPEYSTGGEFLPITEAVGEAFGDYNHTDDTTVRRVN